MELLSRFFERLGARPDGVWAAPGRGNLIGKHTDYNEGFALPFPSDRHTRAAVRRRGDGIVRPLCSASTTLPYCSTAGPWPPGRCPWGWTPPG